jgi:hypothetical protein
MKTKMECLQSAVMCERMSADTDEEANRLALVATAAQWRALADHAPAGEGRIAPDRAQAEDSMTRPKAARSGTPCIARH